MEDKPYVDTAPLGREVWTPTASHDVQAYQAAIARIAELEAMVVEVRRIATSVKGSRHSTIGEHLLADKMLDATSSIAVTY